MRQRLQSDGLATLRIAFGMGIEASDQRRVLAAHLNMNEAFGTHVLDEALFTSPAHPQWGATYGVEPYAMAADVYSAPPYAGRGGWSWYTGAAGWLHRAALESILGLHLEAEELWFTPCLPAQWPRAEITLERDGRSMHFLLVRGDHLAALAACVDPHARLLQVAERLRWNGLPQHSGFVISLPPAG